MISAMEMVSDLKQALRDIRSFPAQESKADESRHMRNLAEMALDGLDNAIASNNEEAIDYPLRARVYTRESTNEKILEIVGTVDDTGMIVRHTQSIDVPDSDVPGLPEHYDVFNMLEDIKAGLIDSKMIADNMRVGRVAKPSVKDIIEIYGADVLRKALEGKT